MSTEASIAENPELRKLISKGGSHKVRTARFTAKWAYRPGPDEIASEEDTDLHLTLLAETLERMAGTIRETIRRSVTAPVDDKPDIPTAGG